MKLHYFYHYFENCAFTFHHSPHRGPLYCSSSSTNRSNDGRNFPCFSNPMPDIAFALLGPIIKYWKLLHIQKVACKRTTLLSEVQLNFKRWNRALRTRVADRIISREGDESWNLISGNLATKWWVSFSILTGNKHDFGACAPVNKHSMNKETLYPSKRRSALDSFRIYNSVADIDSLEVDKPDGNSIYIQSHRLTVANMRFTGNSMF